MIILFVDIASLSTFAFVTQLLAKFIVYILSLFYVFSNYVVVIVLLTNFPPVIVVLVILSFWIKPQTGVVFPAVNKT